MKSKGCIEIENLGHCKAIFLLGSSFLSPVSTLFVTTPTDCYEVEVNYDSMLPKDEKLVFRVFVMEDKYSCEAILITLLVSRLREWLL